MKTNNEMKELLVRYGDFDRDLFPLTLSLASLLDSDIKETDGAFVLAPLGQSLRSGYAPFDDLTGYECAVNHIHIDDYLDPLDDDQYEEILIKSGLVFVDRLRKKLTSVFPREHFRIILSYSREEIASCVVRFHKLRKGETWVLDDLEAYQSEALMLIDTPSL